MNVFSALERRAREARSWLFDACLPLWSREGVVGNLFCETLDLSHGQMSLDTTRVRVQARQTYAFATAAKLGWSPDIARELAEMGLAALSGPARRPDGLFGRTLHTDESGLADNTADLYDTAFALYALAEAGTPDAHSALIAETLQAIDTHLADPAGGFAEALPRPTHRLQNPHMHLFEACLALQFNKMASDAPARADALQTLALDHFIDPQSGTLGERFNADWSIPEGDPGQIIEPGHQFEWVWLFDQHASQTALPPPDVAARLYASACATLDPEGRAIQATLRDGTPHDASRRTWPQTEALKAHLVQWAQGEVCRRPPRHQQFRCADGRIPHPRRRLDRPL